MRGWVVLGRTSPAHLRTIPATAKGLRKPEAEKRKEERRTKVQNQRDYRTWRTEARSREGSGGVGRSRRAISPASRASATLCPRGVGCIAAVEIKWPRNKVGRGPGGEGAGAGIRIRVGRIPRDGPAAGPLYLI